MAYDVVNEDNVYLCVGHPLRRDIENVVKWMLNEHFTVAYNSILLYLVFNVLASGWLSTSLRTRELFVTCG